MAVRPVLRMGDPRLLRVSRRVEAFDTPELHALIADMQDTMRALNGAGLAAPQIGVDLQVVIFGVESNPRYPDAEPVPHTVLVNPAARRRSATRWRRAGKAASPCPACAVSCRATNACAIAASISTARRSIAPWRISMRASCSTKCDHLHGILYPMRIRDMRNFGFTDELFPGEDIADD